jgi:hypothetical protein
MRRSTPFRSTRRRGYTERADTLEVLMARETHEREDLLRDARALVPRVQLRVQMSDGEAVVFAGFRGDALSLYFGDDPVYHFNAQGQLRRAYAADRLIKANRGRLIAMRRERSAGEVALQSEPLPDAQQQQFLADLAGRLATLLAALGAGQFRVEGQEPADGDAIARLAAWLANNPSPTPAASPRIG